MTRWVMQQSLTKALAAKLRISVPKVYARNGTPVDGPRGTGVSRGVWLSVVNEGFQRSGRAPKPEWVKVMACTPPQDPGRLPQLPHGRPTRTFIQTESFARGKSRKRWRKMNY